MSRIDTHAKVKLTTRIYGTIAAILIVANSVGQTIEDASALLARKQLDSALVVAKNIIEHDKSAVDAYVLAGRILVAKKNFSDAVSYLEKAQTFSDAPEYTKAWAMSELGLCYYSKGDYKKAKESLTACIGLNATKNATSSANFSMLKLGFDKFYDTWTTIETVHFNFHFQDTSSFTSVSTFIQLKEAAFDSINNFFKAKLPKKIDYFVWNNPQLAESMFRRGLAFSDGALCITHTEPKHTVGHEMTHSISYNAVQNAKSNRLIAEGVCVYFDLSKRDNIKALKTESPISITNIWKDDSKLEEGIIYPLGGELVKRLIQTFGREKFMQLLADQTYSNAKKIYGAELDTIVDKLAEDIKQ